MAYCRSSWLCSFVLSANKTNMMLNNRFFFKRCWDHNWDLISAAVPRSPTRLQRSNCALESWICCRRNPGWLWWSPLDQQWWVLRVGPLHCFLETPQRQEQNKLLGEKDKTSVTVRDVSEVTFISMCPVTYLNLQNLDSKTFGSPYVHTQRRQDFSQWR